MKIIFLSVASCITLYASAQLKTVYSITPITNIDCDNYVSLINNKFYFQGTNPNQASDGAELYMSDSTQAGTVLIKNINPNSFGSSSPGNFTQLNSSSIIFTANDGTSGRELWLTDGTNSGTNLVKDIYVGSNSGPYEYFTKMGNEVFFMTDDGVNGNELWKTDGTSLGTTLVKNINPSGNGMQMPALLYSKYTAVISGFLYFVASDGTTGYELYKTDGTTSGTSLVKDIYTGTNSSNPSNFVVLNNTLYFTATSASEGTELWKSDGTLAGTVLVKDFSPLTAASSNPNYLVVFNNKIYFSALVSYQSTLCESNGTSVGTNTVFASPSFNSELCRLTKVDSSIYFFDRSTGATPDYSLYKFDGINNSTSLIKSGLYGGTSGPVYQPTKEKAVALNGMLYFTFDNDTNGDELWQSDGTVAGTKMITDIGVGSLTSWIDNLIPVNNGSNSRLYFTSTKKTGLLYINADAVLTNIKEFDNSSFLIFPNPSNGIVNIQLNEINPNSKISVHNVLGEIVFESALNSTTTQLNFSDFIKGIYFVTLENNGVQSSSKIIIQ